MDVTTLPGTAVRVLVRQKRTGTRIASRSHFEWEPFPATPYPAVGGCPCSQKGDVTGGTDDALEIARSLGPQA
jgi:hypothetical protein